MKKKDIYQNEDGGDGGDCQNSDESTIKVLGSGEMDIDIDSEAKACNFHIFNVQEAGQNKIKYDFCATITLKSSIDVTADAPEITSITEES